MDPLETSPPNVVDLLEEAVNVSSGAEQERLRDAMHVANAAVHMKPWSEFADHVDWKAVEEAQEILKEEFAQLCGR